MYTFAQKPTAPRTALSAPAFDRARRPHPREMRSTLDAWRQVRPQPVPRPVTAPAGSAGAIRTTGEASRLGHDFGRLPLAMSQPPFGTSGELAQGPLGDPNDWVPVTGDGGGPSDAGSATVATPMQPPVATPMQTPAATPTLQKTTVSAATASNNGGFNWGVRWSIQNASNATNGWIVQNVAVAQTVTDAKGVPVVPGQGTYGGLSTSWYPLWEAWQVRGGQVFVGGSTSPHNADTYAQNAVGATTKGKTEVTGRADFFPTLTLPTAFAVTNSAPSWALPATTTDPKLTGGTGALDHNLTATWDGVGGPGTTTVTTA